jgi:hypothetical protein
LSKRKKLTAEGGKEYQLTAREQAVLDKFAARRAAETPVYQR